MECAIYVDIYIHMKAVVVRKRNIFEVVIAPEAKSL